MGLFKDIGKGFKRTFSNPTKLVSDISTFGTTAILRTLPKKIGGGQAGFFSKGSEVVGATVIGTGSGFVTGFATGGPGGAIYGATTGGAAGFGRGVSGVTHGESGRTIAAGSAKWGGISGFVGGLASRIASAVAVKGAGAVAQGPVTAGVGSTTAAGTSSAGATAAAASGGSSSVWSTLGTTAALALLQRPGGQPGSGGGLGDISVTSPGSGPGVYTPAEAPIVYPGLGDTFGTSSFPGGSDRGGTLLQQATSPLGMVLLATAVVVAWILLKKKRA